MESKFCDEQFISFLVNLTEKNGFWMSNLYLGFLKRDAKKWAPREQNAPLCNGAIRFWLILFIWCIVPLVALCKANLSNIFACFICMEKLVIFYYLQSWGCILWYFLFIFPDYLSSSTGSTISSKRCILLIVSQLIDGGKFF